MNDGKPSKEQLEQYYKTSRKYFDSLAAQYLQNDRAFYDTHFAPYYNNPFKKVDRPAATKALVFAIIIFMFGVAIFIITLFLQKEPEVLVLKSEPKVTKSVAEKTIISSDTDGKFDTLAVSYLKTDFEKGAYYFGRKNYEAAEEYLKRIKKSDKDYTAAKDVLRRIQKEREKQSTKKTIE